MILSVLGGVACNSKSELLTPKDGGAGTTGAAGTGGGGGRGGGVGGGTGGGVGGDLGGGTGGGVGGGLGGGVAPDGGPDATPDGSTDAPTGPLSNYHWVTLPAPFGAPMRTIALDSQGALYASARTTMSGLVADPPGGTGIFRSSDEGASWRPANLGLFDVGTIIGLNNYDDYDVVALATVGTTVYAGLNDLLRSTDGGASWQRVASDYFDTFNMIAGGGDVVVAANLTHLWLSTDAGNSFQMTTLSGNVLSLDVLNGGAVILLSTDSGVYSSTDAGATFQPVHRTTNQNLFGRVRCDGQHTCYAAAYDLGKTGGPYTLLRSTDAGATWTSLMLVDSDLVLAISDSGSVYIGTAGTARMRRSDDGGVTFTALMGPTTAGWLEPNCDGPLVARGDEVFLACPDGVYRSIDKGQSWQPASGSPETGAITGGAAQIFVDKSPAALGPGGDIYVEGVEGLMPGVSDNHALLRSSDGGWTWEIASPAFSADPCIVTPAGALECPNVVTASMRAQVARSDDHGETWHEVTFPTENYWSMGIGLATDGSTVYLAAGAVARSTDDGRTFQTIPNGPVVVSVQALRNGHLLAAGSNGSAGFRSDDQGATWQVFEFSKLPLVEDGTGRLIRSFEGGSFEISTDEGMTWTVLESTGVPDIGSFALVPLAADGAGHLFVFGADPSSDAKNIGPLQVSMSDDDGAHFVKMPAQIPNPDPTSFATDKQGRLLVATLGGVFRLESDSDPGPPRPDGGMPGTPDGGSGPAPRPLSALTENGPWLPGAAGLAVDPAHRVYVADNSTVYVTDTAGTSSPYLTLAEVASSAGLASPQTIFDIDVGPDIKLYVLLSNGVLPDPTRTDTIVTSSAAHQATRLGDLAPLTRGRMAVIGAGSVGYYTLSEFWSATGAGTQVVYTAAALGWDTYYCVIGDVLINGSGTVAFLPSCGWRPIQVGTVTSGPVRTLYQPIDPSSRYSEHFGCGAVDPAGGFTFMVTDGSGGHDPRLVHLPEAATTAAVPTPVPTKPTLGEVSIGAGGGLFNDCLMAIAPDGVIYVESANGIWTISK
ncbi:MAG TPA: hypothetical protein VKQ32_15000 [Polyangia bacterium]|nr:hypothetical protein [Polyangia bacterium]